jgi:2-polyprenyl-6-methoxyphenol hydroxylase-like FAD-dependent oxidoreductase
LTGGDFSESLHGEALRAHALQAMADWSDAFKTLVRLADAGTINTITIRTSEPVAPWETRRITFLGDVSHAMTPYRGIGANVALKDAMRLRDALLPAHDGGVPLLQAIEGYEARCAVTDLRRARRA